MNKRLAKIVAQSMNKKAGSIDYSVMMDIPKDSKVSKADIEKEINHLIETYGLSTEDMWNYDAYNTITFTLPMESANKLISELENLGFRLLRKEKKDNRTQDEWVRDQNIYD